MAFELFKAKLEARKARREAILAIDKYIKTLSVDISATDDAELKKQKETELMQMISAKDVYKRYTEIPKWAQECLTTALKLVTLVGSVVACEVITNRGTGDKIITDGIKRLPGL